MVALSNRLCNDSWLNTSCLRLIPNPLNTWSKKMLVVIECIKRPEIGVCVNEHGNLASSYGDTVCMLVISFRLLTAFHSPGLQSPSVTMAYFQRIFQRLPRTLPVSSSIGLYR